MNGAIIGFLIWTIVGCLIICIGISALFSKKVVGFWANIKPFSVKDRKEYNRATGLLFICYGIIFVVFGIPLLIGQNSPYILLSILGVMLETIAMMAIYSLVITKKYREQ